jgi:hypothetical protein
MRAGPMFRFLEMKVYPWVAAKAVHRYYPAVLVLICVGLGLLFTFPQSFAFNQEAWDVVVLKSRDLTHPLTHVPPDSWMAKKVFRLSVPVLVRLFHLNALAVMLAQFALGFALLLAAYHLALRILKDAVAATFIAAGMAFLYFGRACFTELYYATFDGWGYCFLILALFFRNRGAVFLCASLAAWTDERACLSLPIVMLFHQMRGRDGPPRCGAKELLPMTSPRSLDGSALAALAALIGYAALREFMTLRYHMQTPLWAVGPSVLKYNRPYLPFGMVTFLEGYWLIVFAALGRMLKRGDLFLALAVLGQAAVSTLVAGCVYDITRSGSFLFPIVFVLLAYLKPGWEENRLRRLAFAAMALTFLFPAYYVVSVWDLFHIDGRPILIEGLRAAARAVF